MYIKTKKKSNKKSTLDAYLSVIINRHDDMLKQGKFKQVVQMYLDLDYERFKLRYKSLFPLNNSYEPERPIGF